jgi:DHA1 family bicyclomycin/chloramphenicol resistance-like MFS transporter
VKQPILTILLAGLAMVGPFAVDTFLPSFPAIGEQFGAGPALVQQTLSVYLFAFSFMTLFYGTLSDSFGRRPVILLSTLVFIAGSIGAALAQSFTMLLVCRAVQGFSAGSGMVVGQAVVRDRLHGPAAQRMIANIMMVFGIAPAVAPIVGGFLHEAFGWRSVFVFMAAIAGVVLAGCFFGLPESLPRESRQPFHPASIAANYLRALRHPQFLPGSLAIGMAFGGYALYIASAPELIIQILHLPLTAFAWLFVPMVGGVICGSAVSSRLAFRVPGATLVRWGFAVMALGSVLNVAYTWFFTATVPWAVLPILLYAFGMSLAQPGMTVHTLGLFPAMRGLAASLQNFVRMLIFALVSGFVAPLLFGSAFKLACGLAAATLLSIGAWSLVRLQIKAPAADQQAPADSQVQQGKPRQGKRGT